MSKVKPVEVNLYQWGWTHLCTEVYSPTASCFLKTTQNVNESQKFTFRESKCVCKFVSQKNKQKKPIKIAFTSWHTWLKNGVLDFFQVCLLFCYKPVKLGILLNKTRVSKR